MELPRQEHHRMVLVCSHPSGADEMYCPTCGRRILIQWPPDYKKTVLETGDEYAVHSGGKGGLEMGAPQLTPASADPAQESAVVPVAQREAVPLDAHDLACLAQWEEWLGQIGFENWWADPA